MGKIERKIEKQKQLILMLEDELVTSLTKKDSKTKEISLPEMQRKIYAAKLNLYNMENSNKPT